MSQVKLTSIDRIISGVYRDLQPSVELNENDLIEWIGEALEQIGAYTQYEQNISYLTVAEHKASIPCGLHKIIQIGYKFTSGSPSSTGMYLTCDDSTCSSCNDLTPCTDCDPAECENLCTNAAQVVQNAELWLQYYKPNNVRRTPYYYDNFRPMRMAGGVFDKSRAIMCNGCENLSATCEEEYSIDHPYIRTSFKDGYICLAYISQPLDENGFPMIPDEVSYIQAIKSYLTFKIKYSEFIKGLLPGQIFSKLEDDWHWYCAQARNKARMPDTVDKMQNLVDQTQRLIPKYTRYYGFFGNLNSPERLDLAGINKSGRPG